MATAELTAKRPSMNEANERDPFNNNCYGTLVDTPLQARHACRSSTSTTSTSAIIRGYEEGYRREGSARRPVGRPLADPRRHGDAARLQLRRPGDSRVHPRELHRLHGLRHRMPRHGHSRQGAGRIGPRSRSWRTIADRADREMFAPAVVEDAQVLRRPAEERTGEGGPLRHHHRPQQVQGLRRVRHRLRRPRPEDDPEDRTR